ncbi:hypothetical protein ACHFI2_01025 [Exiguobacterium acetylicum]|uniref:hypothetical protein n=1 Tax=Exiguobacterium acetylicum TaxID=41170 RepID=UPI003875E86C
MGLQKKEDILMTEKGKKDILNRISTLVDTYERAKSMIDDLKDVAHQIIISNLKFELNEFIESHSKLYDNIILKAIHSENLKFIGGNLVINVNEKENEFSFDMEAYFNDASGEWIKKENSTSYPLSSLVSKDRKELVEASVVKYDLDAPNESEVTL